MKPVAEAMPASNFRLYIWVFTLAIVALLDGCRDTSTDHNVEITIKVSGSNSEMIYLEKVTLEGTVVLDSLPLDKQGEATFSLHTNDFEFVMLSNRSSKSILLTAERSNEILVFADAEGFGDQYTVQGSVSSLLLQQLELQKTSVIRQIDSIGQKWLKERYSGDHVQQKATYDSIAQGMIQNHANWLASYIQQYKTSPAMIVALYQTLQPGIPVLTMEDDLPLFETVSDTLSALYPVNEHVRDLVRRISDFKKEQEAFLQREKQLQPGMPAPAIDLFNIDGEKVSLESFKGRVVLLYFWDARKRESWEVNQQLTNLHKLYKSRGFEILGIYTGADKQLLFTAIQIDQLPWVHLLGNTHTINLYNVKDSPSMLLIDADGKVLHRTITLDELTAKLPWVLPAHGGNLSETPVHGAQ